MSRGHLLVTVKGSIEDLTSESRAIPIRSGLRSQTTAINVTTPRNSEGHGIGPVRSKATSSALKTPTFRVLLLHGGQVPHYRVPVYNHLRRYLREQSFELTVTSEGIQPGNRTLVEFDFVPMHLSVRNITGLV